MFFYLPGLFFQNSTMSSKRKPEVLFEIAAAWPAPKKARQTREYTATKVTDLRVSPGGRIEATVHWTTSFECLDGKNKKLSKVQWAPTTGCLADIIKQFPHALDNLGASLTTTIRTTDTFAAQQVAMRSSKIAANDFFAQALKDHCGSKPMGYVAFLDSEILNTLARLSDIAPQHARVVINMHKTVLQSGLDMPHAEKTNYFYGTAHAYLEQCPQNTLVAIWLDYCATINAFIDDVHLLFSRKVVREGGVVAFTFCTRRSHIKRRDIPTFLLNTAKSVYPRAKVLTDYGYYPAMLLVILKL